MSANPPQEQDRQPGREAQMSPRPDYMPKFPGAGRLAGRTALITGGDSGIGRAVAVAFAREGADIGIIYLEEHEDAAETGRLVEAEGGRFHAVAGNVGDDSFCRRAAEEIRTRLGEVGILVNNAAEQHVADNFEDISADQVERTFSTNVYGYFNMTRACLPRMKAGDVVLNTASVTAFKGKDVLIDYSATRGAVVALTRSLSQNVAERGIRVNAVAPGPIWTPLIPATFDADKVAEFGANTPLGRPGQPNEVAAAFLFLASPESSYVTGQVVHVNGGTVVGS